MSDPRTYTLTAFVLRHHLVGEADKILALFSLEAGLRRVVAKGVRKASSRLAGRLEAFREAEIGLAKGRNLDVVTSADSLRRFPAIATDFDALAAGMAANELLLAFMEENDPHPAAYGLYAELLGLLGPPAPQRSLLLLAAFELQLMELLGYRPDLTACVACDRPLARSTDVAGLHIEGGQVICVQCDGTVSGRVRRLSGPAWQLLGTLQERPLAEVAVLGQVDEGILGNVRLALRDYVGWRAERDLKAQRMFDYAPAPYAPPAL